MSVLTIVLLVVGILALIEGGMVVLFPKVSLKLFRKFVKSAERNLRAWGVAEIIIALGLIVLGLSL